MVEIMLAWVYLILNRQKYNFLVEDPNEDNSDPQNELEFIQFEYQQLKRLIYTLNSIGSFLISLVISFVGSHFRLLRMYWYTDMKPFHKNLILVIKHVCVAYMLLLLLLTLMVII